MASFRASTFFPLEKKLELNPKIFFQQKRNLLCEEFNDFSVIRTRTADFAIFRRPVVVHVVIVLVHVDSSKRTAHSILGHC
jgi:hypothetical protein